MFIPADAVSGATDLGWRTAIEEAFHLQKHGDHPAAIATVREALKAAWEPREAGYLRVALGNSLLATSHFQGSEEEYQYAWDVADKVGDQGLLASALSGLGISARRRGERVRASGLFDLALGARRVAGDKAGEAQDLANLGLLHFQERQFDLAERFYGAARRIAKEVGDEGVIAQVLGYVGNLERARGQTEEALEALAHAREMHAALGDTRGVAQDTGNIGLVQAVM